MRKKIIALAVLACAAAQATAANGPWYVGGDIGSTQFKLEGEKERKTSFGGTVGYSVNQNLAVEVQAHRLGRWSESGVRLTVNAINASALGIMPLGEQFSLYARLGVGRNTVKVSEGNLSASEHETKALFGIGGDYRIAPNLSLRAEFVNLGSNKIGDGVDSISIKVQQFNFGLNYAF